MFLYGLIIYGIKGGGGEVNDNFFKNLRICMFIGYFFDKWYKYYLCWSIYVFMYMYVSGVFFWGVGGVGVYVSGFFILEIRGC